MDWKTPLGVTTIVKKEKNPTWYPPKSVRETHLKDDGDMLAGVAFRRVPIIRWARTRCASGFRGAPT